MANPVNNFGIPDAELNLIKQQAARRAEMRKEFLKLKTNPWKGESGYVFDPAVQRFMSMKVSQFEFFQANRRTSLFGFFALVVPMAAYGYLIWNNRTKQEERIRKGEILYKDRLFKFA